VKRKVILSCCRTSTITSQNAAFHTVADIERGIRTGVWAPYYGPLLGFPPLTLLNVVLAVFPIIDVPNAFAFAAKIGGTVLGLNLAGALFYWRASNTRKAG
jgi:hypothetical protein